MFFVLFSVAGNCGRTAVFPSTLKFHGKKLVGHVIRSVEAPREDVCMAACFLEEDCVSYTFGSGVCDISRSDHVVHPGDLQASGGVVYQAMEVRIAVSVLIMIIVINIIVIIINIVIIMVIIMTSWLVLGVGAQTFKHTKIYLHIKKM